MAIKENVGRRMRRDDVICVDCADDKTIKRLISAVAAIHIRKEKVHHLHRK